MSTRMENMALLRSSGPSRTFEQSEASSNQNKGPSVTERFRNQLDVMEHFQHWPVGFFRHQIFEGRLFEPLDWISATLRRSTKDARLGRHLAWLTCELSESRDYARLFFSSPFDGYHDRQDRYNHSMIGAFCIVREHSGRLKEIAQQLHDIQRSSPKQKTSIVTILALRSLLHRMLLMKTDEQLGSFDTEIPAVLYFDRDGVTERCRIALHVLRQFEACDDMPAIARKKEVCASLIKILEQSHALLRDEDVGRLLFTNQDEGIRWSLVGQRFVSLAAAATLGAVIACGIFVLCK